MYLGLLLGFIIIVVSSNVLVDAASSIAIKFNVPRSLIALTIVAFGTCAPEFAISFNSISSGNGDLALANVIGSCIINIVLVIGLAALANPIRVKSATLKKELPILFGTTLVFCGILLMTLTKDVKVFPRLGGLVLVLLFFIFCHYIYKVVTTKSKRTNEQPVYSVGVGAFLVLLTLVLIVFSSEVIVSSAVDIANSLGISQKIITMFAIVIGTSFPELVMTVASAKKGEFDFALGNIIGTNIFNICIVLGLPILIYGGVEIINFNVFDVVAVLISALILYLFSKNDKKLSRLEGFMMLSIFVIYYAYIVIF